MKCDKCKREMPNKKWKTDNGCKWCDADYRKKKVSIKKLNMDSPLLREARKRSLISARFPEELKKKYKCTLKMEK